MRILLTMRKNRAVLTLVCAVMVMMLATGCGRGKENGGVNPEDVSSREGSFGDLKNGMACTVRESWREGSFYADSIVMSEFV